MASSKSKGLPWWLLLLLGLAGAAATSGDTPQRADPDPDPEPEPEPEDEKPQRDVPDKPTPDEPEEPKPGRADVDPPKGPDPGLDDPKIFNPYPTPRSMYAVKTGDYELGVAKKYVASCLFLAAKNVGGLDDAAANAWAAERNTAQVRLTAVAFFSCCEDNDMRLGTYRFKKCVAGHTDGCTHPAKNGRGIRFLKTGGDTEARARAGKPWRRGPPVGKPGDSPSSASDIPAGERAFPLIYLPEPDYAELWASGGETWLPSPATWADGVSTFRMPPSLRALGIEGVPAGIEWGCTWPS